MRTLLGRHARIARLPRFLARLGTPVNPILSRHAWILPPACPAVKQVETSLQGRLLQSRVELQILECLVADAEKNRVPRLAVDVDLGVEQGVP